MIILDLGSGNTCKNNIKEVRRMIKAVPVISVLKWQLFSKAGDNEPLNYDTFDYAYKYAKEVKGLETTASVFDNASLDFLLSYKIPFVKIANISHNPHLTWLIANVPVEMPLYVSYTNKKDLPKLKDIDRALFCVTKYPADREEYKTNSKYISDHTIGTELYHKLNPEIWEKHYYLADQTGLDAGPWAITPEELCALQ